MLYQMLQQRKGISEKTEEIQIQSIVSSYKYCTGVSS